MKPQTNKPGPPDRPARSPARPRWRRSFSSPRSRRMRGRSTSSSSGTTTTRSAAHLEVRGGEDLARLWRLLRLADQRHDPRRTYFRPATLYSLALDWAGRPAIRVRSIARTWSSTPGRVSSSGSSSPACRDAPFSPAAGAVLYALHPAHPESVAFISGRTDVQSALFLFASLWAAVRFGPRIRSPWTKLVPAALPCSCRASTRRRSAFSRFRSSGRALDRRPEASAGRRAARPSGRRRRRGLPRDALRGASAPPVPRSRWSRGRPPRS